MANPGALALLSPYFWIYSHQLWDNSFLVPLTAATWASYVSFCRKPRAAALFAVVLFSCGMFLAHLMAVSILLPLLVHALAFHRGWLRRNIISLSIPLAIAGLASAYYLRHLFASIVRLLGNHSAAPSLSVFSGWWFPLQGGQFFAATGLEYFFGDQWWQGNAVVHASAVITSMALVLMWAGALAALWRCRPSSTASPLERQVNTLAVGTLVFACFFHGVMRAYGEPHYFNALWIVCFYLIWLLLTIFYEKNPWLGRCVVGLQAVSMAVVLLYLVRTVHLSAGTREPRFGTTLSHQIEIARELTRYHAVNQPHDPVQPGQCEFEPPLRYLSFQVIQEIYGLKASPTAPALPGIWVGYRTKNSSDGWLVIETKPSM